MSKLEDRIKKLEEEVRGEKFYSYSKGLIGDVAKLKDYKGPTLRVSVVDENGVAVTRWNGYCRTLAYKDISFEDVCKALQDMCDIQITYQEKSGGVVIYEKDRE